MIKKDEITLKPLTDKDISLFESWLDKEYIKKWFGDKEDWLSEINERNGTYNFLKHFIVYYNGRRIGYCLYGDCFYIKNLEEEAHDFKSVYGDVAEENHTYEIGFLIGEQEYLNKGIGKIIIQMLEAKIVEIGGKEIASDPDEENIISIRTLLCNGFHKKNDGDYRKVIVKTKSLKLFNRIETERIYIRPIQHTDANAIFAYRSLECVAQYQYWEPFTVQKSLEFVEQNSCVDMNAKGVWIGLAIILKSSNELIGDCALKIDGQTAELGCNISPKHQRQGYAHDALSLLIDLCFSEFEVSEVFGITDSENLSSVKLMQSLGMNKNETFENKILCKGRLSVEHKCYVKK